MMLQYISSFELAGGYYYLKMVVSFKVRDSISLLGFGEVVHRVDVSGFCGGTRSAQSPTGEESHLILCHLPHNILF